MFNDADSIASRSKCILPDRLWPGQFCSWTDPLKVPSFYNPLPRIALSQHWKWLSKMVAATCKRKLPVELCPQYKNLSSKSSLNPLPQKRTQGRKRRSRKYSIRKFPFWNFCLLGGVGRDQATDFLQTRDAYPTYKERPRKPDTIHFVKDDSGDLEWLIASIFWGKDSPEKFPEVISCGRLQKY